MALVLISSSASLAASKCEVRGNGSIFKTNGEVFKNVSISDVFSKTREKSWEDCYRTAIKFSERYDSSMAVSVSGGRVAGGSAETLMHLYFDWSFDDSSIPFLDTAGKVTKYSSRYENYAQEGDMRYFSDGRIFE